MNILNWIGSLDSLDWTGVLIAATALCLLWSLFWCCIGLRPTVLIAVLALLSGSAMATPGGSGSAGPPDGGSGGYGCGGCGVGDDSHDGGHVSGGLGGLGGGGAPGGGNR